MHKNQLPKSRDTNYISLDKVISFLSLFKDRRADIVAYRVAIYQSKGMSYGSLDQRKVVRNIKILNQEMGKRNYI